MQFKNLSLHVLRATLFGILMSMFSATVSANAGEATNLVAPYAHFPMSFGPATGPYTTHYLVSGTVGVNTTVNVKCYNDGQIRVGPAGGSNFSIGNTVTGYDVDVISPLTLGITTDPSYTGLGWCYFAVTSGNDIAVAYVLGVSEGGNLITTNNSRFVTSGTAQNQLSVMDGNIPYWTREGSWDTFVLLLNPTTSSRSVTVDFYNEVGTLLGTYTGLAGLGSRDLDFTSAATLGLPATFGNANVAVSGRGFVGWVAALNVNSGAAFFYNIPLDKDDLSALVNSDRP